MIISDFQDEGLDQLVQPTSSELFHERLPPRLACVHSKKVDFARRKKLCGK
jgi:hypothetical protein